MEISFSSIRTIRDKPDFSVGILLQSSSGRAQRAVRSAAEGEMARFRYRTSVLVGPWRETPERAAADAVRSGQARADVAGENLVWIVPGKIEFDTEGKSRPRA